MYLQQVPDMLYRGCLDGGSPLVVMHRLEASSQLLGGGLTATAGAAARCRSDGHLKGFPAGPAAVRLRSCLCTATLTSELHRI